MAQEHFQITRCIKYIEYIRDGIILRGEFEFANRKSAAQEFLANAQARVDVLRGMIMSHKKSARFGSF